MPHTKQIVELPTLRNPPKEYRELEEKKNSLNIGVKQHMPHFLSQMLI